MDVLALLAEAGDDQVALLSLAELVGAVVSTDGVKLTIKGGCIEVAQALGKNKAAVIEALCHHGQLSDEQWLAGLPPAAADEVLDRARREWAELVDEPAPLPPRKKRCIKCGGARWWQLPSGAHECLKCGSGGFGCAQVELHPKADGNVEVIYLPTAGDAYAGAFDSLGFPLPPGEAEINWLDECRTCRRCEWWWTSAGTKRCMVCDPPIAAWRLLRAGGGHA